MLGDCGGVYEEKCLERRAARVDAELTDERTLDDDDEDKFAC
jgi:hypothetical protein